MILCFIVFVTSDLTDISPDELLNAFGDTVRLEEELRAMTLSALITKVNPKDNTLSVSSETANHENSDKYIGDTSLHCSRYINAT